MTDREAFEKWFESKLALCEYDIDYVKAMNRSKGAMLEGYLAAKQDSTEEIAELKSKLDLKVGVIDAMDMYRGYQKLEIEIAQLQADNLKLREALEIH